MSMRKMKCLVDGLRGMKLGESFTVPASESFGLTSLGQAEDLGPAPEEVAPVVADPLPLRRTKNGDAVTAPPLATEDPTPA